MRRPHNLAVVAIAFGLLLLGEGLLALATSSLLLLWWLAGDALPLKVLPLVLTIQWVQIVAGPVYVALTGRRLPEVSRVDWEPMVVLAIASIAAMAAAVRFGLGPAPLESKRTDHIVPTGILAAVYGVTLAGEFALTSIAASTPSVTQILVSAGATRIVALVLFVGRLLDRRRASSLAMIVAIVTLEVVVGSADLMGRFLMPVLAVSMVVSARVDWRRPVAWAGAGAGIGAMLALLTMWTGIKHPARRLERKSPATSFTEGVDRLGGATVEWLGREPEQWLPDFDALVSRVWAMEYPARAMRRIPSQVPHENGRLILDAVSFVSMPRALFPDKPTLRNADSGMVRRYAGVWVAGDAQQTSIAFGHLGESYVDFGVVGTLGLEACWGLVVALLMRLAVRWIRDRELAQATVAAVALQALFSCQTSWTMMLGGTLSMVVVIVPLGALADRLIRRRASGNTDRARSAAPAT